MSATNIYIKKFKKLINSQRIKNNALTIGDYAIKLTEKEIDILNIQSNQVYIQEHSGEIFILTCGWEYYLTEYSENIISKLYKELKMRLDNE